jgi:hypothetical protein
MQEFNGNGRVFKANDQVRENPFQITVSLANRAG